MTRLPKKIFVTKSSYGYWCCNNEIVFGENHREGLGTTVQAAIGDWLIKNQGKIKTQVHERSVEDGPTSRRSVRAIKANEPSFDPQATTFKAALRAWLETEIKNQQAILSAPWPTDGFASLQSAGRRMVAEARMVAYQDLLNAEVNLPPTEKDSSKNDAAR